MNIAMAYFYDHHEEKIAISKQLGVTNAVINACPKDTVVPKNGKWDFESFRNRVKRFHDNGITVSVVEGPTPLDKVKLGLQGRDQEIEVFCKLLHVMGELGIPTVCYNWMPVIGWFRSLTDIQSRGGATVTGYKHSMMCNEPLTEYGIVTKEQLWDNLTYFLKAVVPVAEHEGVQLAAHPDDPPVDSIRGISRILTSFDAFKKLIELVPSKYNGITLCQGCFATMGEDVEQVIKYFAQREKLFFAHFRDVKGTPDDFYETFHDDGKTDMYKCMKLYHKYNLDICIRPDHVPTMLGEKNIHPGYSVMGNLFAVGYMKGLMEASKKEINDK